MIVRESTEQDISQLVELRMQLFVEMGDIEHTAAAPRLREATEAYFIEATQSDYTRSWIAFVNETVVATGTLTEFRRPPYLGNLAGREAYLLNMFTLPPYRRKGVARQLLNQITAFAKSQGYGKVWLHASQDGRILYEHFGFAPNPHEMEWILHQ